MNKKLLYLIPMFLFSMCSSDHPSAVVIQKEQIIEEDSIPTLEMMYVDIEPILKSDTSWVYDFLDISIELKPESKIGYYNGIDFTVYNFILKNGDTIGMDINEYPMTPTLYSFALKKKAPHIEFTNSFVEKAKNNNNHLIEKEYTVIRHEYVDDTTYSPVFDTMYREIYVRETTTIWISKPLENRKGQTDATVIFKEDSIIEKYHFFGNTKSFAESEKIIELAKQIK